MSGLEALFEGTSKFHLQQLLVSFNKKQVKGIRYDLKEGKIV